MKKIINMLLLAGLWCMIVLTGCSESKTKVNSSDKDGGNEQGTAKGLVFEKIADFSEINRYPDVKESCSDADAYVCVIGPDAAEKVLVPSEYKGLPVMAVIGSKEKNTATKELHISDGVVVIEALFNWNNNTLLSLSVPESVETISDSFVDCSALQEIEIKSDPKRISSSFVNIGAERITFGDISGEIKDSFRNLSSIKELSFGSVDNPMIINSFEKLSGFETLKFNGVVDFKKYITDDEQYVNAFLFNDGDSPVKLIFCDEVKQLPECFCSSCETLESVTFGKDVALIAEKCFMDCENLSEIVFEGKVETIDAFCFSSCEIGEMTFDHDIGTINKCAFQSCENLSTVTFKGSLGQANDCFALCDQLETVTFENYVEKLDGSFNKCSSLKEVTFEGDTDTIKTSFTDCPALETVMFNGSIKHLDGVAFLNSENVVLENLSGDVAYGTDELKQRFDSGQQMYRGYYDKLNQYDVKVLKEWVEQHVAGQSLDGSKKISPGEAVRYADVLNGPIISNSRCTDCPYEEYNPENAKKNEYFVNTIKELKKSYPDTVYTDAKALKAANGEAPIVIGVAESMGYIPLEYIDKNDAGHTEIFNYEMMRVSLWNIETGELLAWYEHQDGEAPIEYTSNDRSDYVYQENIGMEHKFYFLKGGYGYPANLLLETIYPDKVNN